MHGHVRLRVAAPALLLALATLAACGDRSPPRGPAGGAAGLLAFLEHRDRDDRGVGGCIPDRATFDRLVTRAYRGLATGDAVSMHEAWSDDSPVQVREVYADDEVVPPDLRRVRPALPVGRPPLAAFIGADTLPALWVFDAGRWVCLVDLDAAVVARIADADCRRAYRLSSAGRCLDITAPVATAALTADREALARHCALLDQHGCGSVGTDSPAP